jgi:putative ABC transport system ATP-binding protein
MRPAPLIESPTTPHKPDFISLHGVSKSYQEGGAQRSVLHEADFAAHEGEIVVLLGRSGSGKSTLLNLLSGIDLPDTGDVCVGGQAINALSERDRTMLRRQHIGFVFQFFNLLPTLTVEENLLLPLELNGRTSRNDREAALELLSEVGLLHRAQTFPDRLSGGEQQRVAIVRALVHRPLLVLADEPTGNLDFETGLHVLDLLDRLVRRAGKTMVMATHSKDVIGLADRIVTVREGKIETQSTVLRSRA